MKNSIRNYPLEQKLCSAIKAHRVIRLRYDGERYWRTFEPQAIYRSTADQINITGIQTQSEKKPLSKPEPRNFELAKISEIAVTDKEFRYDPNFDPRDKRFAHGVICVIQQNKTDY